MLSGYNLENTRFYINKHYEKEIDSVNVTRHYHYIYGDNGVVALHIANGNTGADSMYYIHTDHLGSYCAITSPSKKLAQRNYFDPWGNMPKIFYGHYQRGDTIFVNEPYSNGDSLVSSEAPTLNFSLTQRGFTGHEHYPYFKIINMNGRLYDPVIGRFFSPDNFVQSYDHTQSFNRYTYARNCPLMYIDPTGEYEYNWYVESNFWIPIGDNGGNYTQYVNIMNGFGANVGTYTFPGPATNLTTSWNMDAFGGIYFSINGCDYNSSGGHWYSSASLSGVYSPGYYYGDNIFMPPNYNVDYYNSTEYTPFASGRVEYSPINIEDFIFIGQFFKGLFIGAKSLITNMVATSVEGGVAEATAIAAATAKEVGKYSVYQGLDRSTEVVKYVGITSRTPATRFAEHLSSSTARSALQYRLIPGAEGLTKTQARILEQNLINQHGLNNLLNLRNSIDPKYWWLYDIKP